MQSVVYSRPLKSKTSMYSMFSFFLTLNKNSALAYEKNDFHYSELWWKETISCCFEISMKKDCMGSSMIVYATVQTGLYYHQSQQNRNYHQQTATLVFEWPPLQWFIHTSLGIWAWVVLRGRCLLGSPWMGLSLGCQTTLSMEFSLLLDPSSMFLEVHPEAYFVFLKTIILRVRVQGYPESLVFIEEECSAAV